jgi:aminopeptidase N
VELLAETMGPEAFEAFLRDYYQTYRWGTVTEADFKQTAERHCGCDLTELFETWVYKSVTNTSEIGKSEAN